MQKPLPSAATGSTQGPTQPLGATATQAGAPTVPVGPPPPPPGVPGVAPTIPVGTPGQGGANPAATLPNPSANLRGWYPRWWLLSALFCSALIGMIALLLPTLCSGRTNSLLCEAANWTDWRQILVMGCVWLLFLTGWLIAHIFGVGTIEVDRQSRGPIARALRVISEFETVYPLLYIYALLAFWIIVFMWRFNQFQPMGFNICSLVIFVGVSCFMHQSSPQDRRTWLLGTVIFTVFCIVAMFWFGPMQFVLLTAEILVVLVGLLCFFRTNPNPPTPSPVQIAAMIRANQMAPGQVFMSLLRAAFRR